MYVADYTGHNVLQIDMKSRKISVLAHEPKMNQPNDLAIGPAGITVRQRPQLGSRSWTALAN